MSSTAVTLFMQFLGSVLALLLGVMALRAARLVEGRAGAMWLLTGMAFTLMGINGVLQDTWAVVAVLSGEGSVPYELYVRWSPVGNYGRAVLVCVFALLLAVAPFLKNLSSRPVRVLMGAVLVLGLVLGGWIGAGTGAIQSAKHWSAAAVLDSLELVLLLGALMIGLLTLAMDQILWLTLAVYAFHAALNVAAFSALAWFRVPGAWTPPPKYVALFIAVTYLVMLVLTLRRSRLARRGVAVPALLEQTRAPTPLVGFQ